MLIYLNFYKSLSTHFDFRVNSRRKRNVFRVLRVSYLAYFLNNCHFLVHLPERARHANPISVQIMPLNNCAIMSEEIPAFYQVKVAS